MFIELRRGIILRQGSFTAVIAPEQVILSAFAAVPDLRRFLFLFLCGSSSRLLPWMDRTSENFAVRRPLTADQLLTELKKTGHTIIFIEHNPALFADGDRVLAPVAAALHAAGSTALLVLYAPALDPSFATLARHADRTIEILLKQDPLITRPYPGTMACRRGNVPAAQKTLGVL